MFLYTMIVCVWESEQERERESLFGVFFIHFRCSETFIVHRRDFAWKRKLYADMQKRRHINYVTRMNKMPTTVSYMDKN